MTEENPNVLDEILAELNEVNKLEKELKVQKETLRKQLFEIAADSYKGKEYLLPITTVTIPKEFWYTTGLPPDEFLLTRYPTWDLTHTEDDPMLQATTFVLRKKPEYMPFSFDGESLKVSKQSTEPTPEIDWETLEAEQPQIFEKVAKKVVHLELNEDAIPELQKEYSDFTSILQRHVKVTREPQQRVSIKEL